jgi:hypothetical protein
MRLIQLPAVGVAIALAAAGCRTWVVDSARPLITIEPVAVNVRDAPIGLESLLTDQLTARLVNSERFTVLEDIETRRLMDQTLGHTQVTSPRDAQILSGALERARFGVQLEVLDCETDDIPNPFPSWMYPNGAAEARVNAHLRVVNLENGQSIVSERIETQRRSRAFGTPPTGMSRPGTVEFDETPLGEACEEVVHRAVKAIERRVEPQAWTPMVARVEDRAFIINGGEDRGVRVGDRFQLFRQATEIRDPQSGRLLGVRVSEPMGAVHVTEVWPRCSACELPSGWQVEPGMVLKPVEIRRAHFWDRWMP